MKAATFLVEWMHLVVPKLNEFLDDESQKVNLPGGTFEMNINCLLNSINLNQEIYNCRLSNNSEEILQKLLA